MKKRAIFALLCAATMCACFAACGETNPDSANTEQGTDNNTNNDKDAVDAGLLLTAETDFSSLVSDKVTKAQWDAAFSDEGFAGCTVKMIDEQLTQTTNFGYKKTENGFDILFDRTFPMEEQEVHVGMLGHVVGTEITDYRTMPQAEGDPVWYTRVRPESEIDENTMAWELTYRQLVSYDLSGHFEAFGYDETKHAYVYEGDTLVVTYSPMEAMGPYHIKSAVVKFAGSKVAYVQISLSQSENAEFFYYNYGKTKVTIPENAQPMPEE